METGWPYGEPDDEDGYFTINGYKIKFYDTSDTVITDVATNFSSVAKSRSRWMNRKTSVPLAVLSSQRQRFPLPVHWFSMEHLTLRWIQTNLVLVMRVAAIIPLPSTQEALPTR